MNIYSKKEVAILVPNYNGKAFIKKTVLKFNYFFKKKVIVVDDKSTDNSCQILSKLDCKLLKKEKNGGFACAINVGLKYLKKKNFKYAVVSNSDVVIDAGVANKINNSLKIFKKDNKLAILGYLEQVEDFDTEKHIQENISGFFFVLKLQIINKIGYFDEKFYMYGEEQDYFRRVIKHGYRIHQTGIKIFHHGELSSKKPLINSWLAIRNSIYLEFKEKKIVQIIKKFFLLLLIINSIYFPKNYGKDFSTKRVKRAGLLRGNFYLILAIIWSFNQIFRRKIKI